MIIKIEIPDCWIDTNQPLIDIIGENFIYSSPNESTDGIQSQFSQVDNEKDENLRGACQRISDEIRYLLKNKLI